MCGICGKVYFDHEHVVTRQEIFEMSHTLVHRGPDGEGVWMAGNVGLAHRRLAIIDLRTVASQPMSNEDGSVWITFNGEIYNFQELRTDLEARGHVFRTASDTEVIVHAYEEYGRQCLDRLRGMFAFAIWDARKRLLFLARDRVGKKPLFYYFGRDRFLFASEIKSLLTDHAVLAEPDPVALDHFLALQYIPAPLTAFRGVQKLPPAHWLEVRDGHIEIGRYWKLKFTPKRQVTLSEAVAELRWRFAEAVRLRLVSDVPLGAFLSGGIDSSAVVATMAQEMGRSVQTFAVGFEDAAFDERPFARQVAERYGTTHTELMVKAPVTDILPRLVWHYDEPFGDASAVPNYAIAALTSQHVTVVLNGDGGDENFAGYEWYLKDQVVQRGALLPLCLRQWIASLGQGISPASRRFQLFHKMTHLAQLLTLPPAQRYAYWLGHFPPEARQQLYTPAFNAAVLESNPEGLFSEVFGQSETEEWVDTMLDADVNLYLPEDLLVKVDRATMAHSLEARSPFLDHVFMEFVASLPSRLKLAGGQQKRVLKAALQDVLPKSVLERPKMGFCVPLARWFREELREMAHDILLAPRAMQRGYFRPQTVAKLLDTHCRGEANHAEYLWDLLMLELWHQTFADGKDYTTSVPSSGLTDRHTDSVASTIN
jgi:asparagine synthase (glutamine-hydrolysing)